MLDEEALLTLLLLAGLSEIEDVAADADMLMEALMDVLIDAPIDAPIDPLIDALMEALETIDEPLAPADIELEVGGALLELCDDEE